MQQNRRKFLIGTAVATGALSIAGYKDTLLAATTLKDTGTAAKDTIYGDSPEADFKFQNGEVILNKDFKVLPSVCNGCTTHCGVRVKVDNSGQIHRIYGNPYSLLSTDPWLGYDTSIKDSFKFVANNSEKLNRSTVCARGNIVFDKINDTFRVTSPLKRVGKRGENRWIKISPKQLIDELVNGGDLFGEGYIKGLKKIRDLNTPIDENNPEFGSMANKLAIIGTADEGRQQFMQHRFMQSFGTINYAGHTGTCGLSMRAGEACYLNDFQGYPHLKPDFEHCKFLLNIATAPSQAGNPFKRQAKLLAKARTFNNCKYVTITPNLTNSDNISVGSSSKWIPIIPGTDLALVMGMIGVIIDEKRFNKNYLEIPSQYAMEYAKECSFSNATYLIDKKSGKFIKDENGEVMVFDQELQAIIPAKNSLRGELFYEDENLKTSFTVLAQNAKEYSLQTYAKICGIKEEEIINLAREFTSYGRAVGVDCHGGTMHTTGFYTTYAVMMLGALVGNLNYKGGMSSGGGRFADFNGVKYNLIAYKGKVKPSGVRIDKCKFPYEKTTEYKNKVANGENPYPAKGIWYPLTNAIQQDFILNSYNKYPYSLDCLLSWNANFIYAQSGSEHIKEILSDPKKGIPLFVAIDPFINETSRYADYIVPDSVMFETWGVVAPWGASQTKANHLRFPIIKSKNDTFENGEPISMDSFVIELGKALGLPGFGEGAINTKDGEVFSLDRAEDFYLRAFENIALDADGAKDITDEEFLCCGLKDMYEDSLQRICPQTWRKVAYVMARGGRFDDKKNSYQDNHLKKQYKNPIAVYNENLALYINSLNGTKLSGSPRYYEPKFADGTKLNVEDKILAFSYKSAVFSSATAASSMLKRVQYTTFIDLNPITAKNHNVNNGDTIKLISDDGAIEGICRLKEGIHPLSVGIEHGCGRDGERGISVAIDDEILNGLVGRKTGICINKLGLKDNSKGEGGTLCDFVIGSNARQAIPIRIERV